MDTSRFKRRRTQTQRQTIETPFGNSPPVPKALPTRPQPSAPIQPPQSAAVPPPAISTLSPLDSSALNRLRSPSQLQDIRPRRPFVANIDAPQPSPAARQPVTPMESPLSPFSQPQNMAQTVTRLAVTPPPEAVPPPEPPRRLPSLDMGLPGEDSPTRPIDSLLQSSRILMARRWAFRGTAAALCLFIIAGGLLFSQAYLKAHKVFKGGTATAEALKPTVNPDLLKGEGRGRVNVLLLGRGGGNHDAPDLTDTIILASIDPVNHTSTLLSIPRDLWVNIPSTGAMKINAAYQSGVFKYLGKNITGSTDKKAVQAGFNQVDQAVEDVVGVDIDYNVMLNFKAFEQAINTVGGLDVNVPTDLVDPTMAWENGNNPLLAKAGPQTFDGKHALNYVRSRETTSDFARSQRQRTVLLGLKTKVDTVGTLSNPLKISGLINAFGDNVQTDLSLKNATRLYSIIKRISDTQTNSIGLADAPNQYVTTGNLAGQSIVLPKAGIFKYGDIQTFVRSQLKDPYIVNEKARVAVLNGTTLPGIASATSDQLKSYGYNVVGATNTPTSGWTQTTLINLSPSGKNKYTKNYLEKRFGIKAVTTMPDNSIQTYGADFVIIIGSDKATPQQTQTH